MTRADLLASSEEIIRSILRRMLPADVPVYLFGSRSRGDRRWNSDFDLWVDANVPREHILAIEEQLEDSIVPFGVDIVTTRQLKGEFGQRVRQEAIQWM
jgi:predicted nucleotidyltransferase